MFVLCSQGLSEGRATLYLTRILVQVNSFCFKAKIIFDFFFFWGDLFFCSIFLFFLFTLFLSFLFKLSHQYLNSHRFCVSKNSKSMTCDSPYFQVPIFFYYKFLIPYIPIYFSILVFSIPPYLFPEVYNIYVNGRNLCWVV